MEATPSERPCGKQRSHAHEAVAEGIHCIQEGIEGAEEQHVDLRDLPVRDTGRDEREVKES